LDHDVDAAILRATLPEYHLGQSDGTGRKPMWPLDRYYEPEPWRLKGELLLARFKDKRKTARSASRDSQAKEAERCFQCALKITRDRNAISLELRAHEPGAAATDATAEGAKRTS
jgi:hypothetical protein